jgi:hypothetical protein
LLRLGQKLAENVEEARDPVSKTVGRLGLQDASSLAVGTFKPEVAKEAWKEQPSPNGAPPLKGSLTCLTHEDLCRVLGKSWKVL